MTYRVVAGDEDGLFSLDEVSGELSWVGAALDDETSADLFSLIVAATADSGLSAWAAVSIAVADLSAVSEPAGEDLSASRDTAGRIVTGEESVSGSLPACDSDWYAMTLTEGLAYSFTLLGENLAARLTVYDGDGDRVTDVDGRDGTAVVQVPTRRRRGMVPGGGTHGPRDLRVTAIHRSLGERQECLECADTAGIR